MNSPENSCEANRLCLDPDTARALAKYGITVINTTNRTILRRDATVVATLSKTGSRLLGPAITLLDAKFGNGILVFQTRMNIDRYQEATGDITTTAKMRQMLAQKDHIGVVLKLAEKEYPYQNIRDLLGQ